MKHGIRIAGIVLAAAAAMTVSCGKEENTPAGSLKIREATVTVNISGNAGTKTIFVPTGDDKVNDIAILIFRNNSATDLTLNNLDGSYIAASPSSLSGVKVKSTAGNKNIYVVANAHGTLFTDISDESDFKQKLSNLKKEDYGDFTMVGSELGRTLEAGEAAANTMTVEMSRVVARIIVSKIDADFSGTALAGRVLTDVKVYITNVRHSKYLFDGISGPDDAGFLNFKGSVPADSPVTGMKGMISQDIASAVGTGDEAAQGKKYFHAYENTLVAETDALRFTRIVIQGNIDGITYFWPININREGFRASSPGHDGVKANHTYEYNVKITKIGIGDPDAIIENAVADVTLSVKDWITVPSVSYEF